MKNHERAIWAGLLCASLTLVGTGVWAGDGFNFGPAQGGPSGTVTTTGTGLSGAGTAGSPLAIVSPVTALNGGTGQTGYAVGDLLYASTTTALTKLPDVAAGSVLVSGGVGVAPAYDASPSLGGQLNWITGLGAITHLTGPTDQNTLIRSGQSATDGRDLRMTAADGVGAGDGGDCYVGGGQGGGTAPDDGGDLYLFGGAYQDAGAYGVIHFLIGGPSGTEYARESVNGFDFGSNRLLGGSAIGTSDASLYRSGTKTWTVDDGSSGAATLAVVGNITATTTISAQAGSISSVGYRINADANTGIFGVADSSIGHSIAGTNRLNVTTAGADVTGALTATTTIAATTFYTGGNGTVTNPTYGFTGNSSNTGMYLGGGTDDRIGLVTDGTERFRIGTTIHSLAGELAFGTIGAATAGIKASGITGLVQTTDGAGNGAGVLTGNGPSVTLTDNTATTVATITMTADKGASVIIDYSIVAIPGSGEDEVQVHTGTVQCSAYDNDGGAVTGTVSEVQVGPELTGTNGAQGLSTGTLTHVWTIVDGTNSFTIKCQSDSSLTSPAITLRVNRITVAGSSGVVLASIP